MDKGAAGSAPVLTVLAMPALTYQLKERTSDRSQAVANSEMNRMMFTVVSMRLSILILLMSLQPLNTENLDDLLCVSGLKPNTISYVIIRGDKFIIKLTRRIMNTSMPVET